MRLEGTGGCTLGLQIEGYEFPDLPGSRLLFDHDANWLMVSGRASDGARAWSFRDACLLTTDVRRLAGWLAAVADGVAADEAIDFMEPNLEFRRVTPPGARPVVRVVFRLEARPPWVPNTTADDGDGAHVDFAMLPDALRAAADDLSSQLTLYPER
jgi:hypothetical protein